MLPQTSSQYSIFEKHCKNTHPHVITNMATIDVLAVDLSIKLLVILAESSKMLFTVRNIESSIKGTLWKIKQLLAKS